MPIKHKKINLIPDGADASRVLPSDWNDDHNHIPFVYYFLSGALTWTNMPSALTEFGGTVYRNRVDLTYATDMRLVVSLAVLGATNALIRVQYSADQSSWAYIDGASGPAVTISGGSIGVRDSGWVSLTAAVKADVYLRIVGITGDGAVDPQFRSVSVQVR